MTRYHFFVFVMLAVALTGYLLPWIVAPSSSMSLNAFDLAEWTSLHPLQRSSSFPLSVPLQLRLHLLILLAIFALISKNLFSRAVAAVAILLVAAAQLPPAEFVSQLGDANYRQQFALAAASIVLPLLLRRYLPKRHEPRLIITLSAIGVAVALAGQKQAETLYALALEEGRAGLGLFIVAVAYIAIIAAALMHARSKVSGDS